MDILGLLGVDIPERLRLDNARLSGYWCMRCSAEFNTAAGAQAHARTAKHAIVPMLTVGGR